MNAPQAALAPQDQATYRYRWLILVGLITAAVMEVLDTTIVNVALPQMAGNLGATFQEISWVSTGYILSNVVVLPMTAFLTSTFGRRNYLVASIAVFIVASFLCGTSGSLRSLVIWRVVQGAGGAALLSTAQATIRQIFKREEQGLVQAIFLLGIIVAPTLGPTLGGVITDRYTWNWCFFINVPIGIISALLVGTLLHDPPGMRRRVPIDWFGIGLLFVGLGCLQYVLEEGRRSDWFSDKIIVRFTVISALCLLTMLVWELSPRNAHPVVDLRVLKNRQLSGSLALFIALGFGLYGGIFIFPLFTQTLLGFSPTETGLTLMPGGVATACTAILCGRMLSGARPLVDARILIYIGIVLFIVSMWTLGHLTTAAGESDARWALVVRGAALGFLFTPINQIAYGSIEPRIAQQAAGLINLARQLGGSFGIAVLATFMDHRIAIHRSDLVSGITFNAPAFLERQHAAVSALLARG
ncbi:MAG TPA: DHA2 family efflux MFS transporter permease subunit, partial [Gemmatimonadaceae bacterium]|nr:DHA2 family efflux MFS transporter permease subunit [Gemmatimonadaceae bacterium]